VSARRQNRYSSLRGVDGPSPGGSKGRGSELLTPMGWLDKPLVLYSLYCLKHSWKWLSSQSRSLSAKEESRLSQLWNCGITVIDVYYTYASVSKLSQCPFFVADSPDRTVHDVANWATVKQNPQYRLQLLLQKRTGMPVNRSLRTKKTNKILCLKNTSHQSRCRTTCKKNLHRNVHRTL